ncbi:DLW-39 family protein [Micromonospora sp. DT233]
MFKKLLILAGVVGVAAVVARKIKTSNHDRAVWHEATTATTDLR